ncbi:aminotransferase class I/II-fold pyridoxal phosphate-dependent enzyme [Rhizobium laguerreae]|uniref:aminotransferase class I/II-fold pyridoxal phosphate-dependent enzyme n=1 Tax=Rhizobium laguerreae TaxID=1076926 RepID=UPI001C91497C|nr:aminotransferase class I/II-fold pyridoxal phosphate-dependent enzyme [Rhizobium laguerreae]MBY3259944.1 aminotransferase class I/II-fold pyridoxal phosphate-dependent enzyme [Rhizobium laguerreae]MBY3287404.1 aminotransferase class I/II-fold pyridoxal phosphate-dependent enzyme [Rhizobium laguerreae]MBY3294293.1 aminotransferase class I/II-fold pyridoxal phosphate-dependent enzyme [Rhizobium laguerreae]
MVAIPDVVVLIVGTHSAAEQKALRRHLQRKRSVDGDFAIHTVLVQSFEDALHETRVNSNLQAVVIYHGFPLRSQNCHLATSHWGLEGPGADIEAVPESERGPTLGRLIAEFRPELDLYFVTDGNVEEIAARTGEIFKRIFFRGEDCDELYPSIIRNVVQRYDTPFFFALREHAKLPVSNFHALPVSRGKSVRNSKWIGDFGQFFGMDLFSVESSATSGGLDSLLNPRGPLKLAQQNAARAFGAKRSFFVTNGTSTANKIVAQALVRPGDVVLVDRNCHKSHHYGLELAGGRVEYLDPYPLNDYCIYGGVPLRELKRALLAYKHAGTLDRVRVLLLTNSTFDGIVCTPQRVMEECLAIAPHLSFLWDEAWFAFAYAHPTYRQRTAMKSAAELSATLKDPDYATRYEAFSAEFDAEAWEDHERVLNTRLLPDPSKAGVRVYATQSTHKTLTALRQGSMIHIWDQEFNEKTEEAFHEAYMMHTSTSPSYPMLASLDVARRQVEMEGYGLVQHRLELAMSVREQLPRYPQLKKYYRILGVDDLVPPEYRESNAESYFDEKTGWSNFETAWRTDEFALDPTHITLDISATGLSGDTFKHKLMNEHNIQINKTTRNTVLFIVNIGNTRSDVAHLFEVLVKIARETDDKLRDLSTIERGIHDKRVHSLTQEQPPLPNLSAFHPAFRAMDCAINLGTRDGDIRSAFSLSLDNANCEYLPLTEVEGAIAGGRKLVSASLITPYPPGSPILVSGQLISPAILQYLRALDVREIHGFDRERGLRVFREKALTRVLDAQKSTAEHGGAS